MITKRILNQELFQQFLMKAEWNIKILSKHSTVTKTAIQSWLDKSSSPGFKVMDKIIATFNNRFLELDIENKVTANDLLIDITLPDPRLEEMLKMQQEGKSRTEIGKSFDLSRERVRQVMGNYQDIQKEIHCHYCDAVFIASQSKSLFCNPVCSNKYNSWKEPKQPYHNITNRNADIIASKIKIHEINGCWEWQGTCNKVTGYTRVWWNHKRQTGHRVLWQIVYGEIPEKQCVLHKCDNPKCLNPRHLFLGTKGDNNKDRENKGRGKAGHLFSDNQIHTIRLYCNNKNHNIAWLAESYDCHPITIWNIIKYKTYKHVE